MRKLVTTLFLLACAVAVAPAARAQSLLFDYVGFDYESPNPNPGTFGELGSGYVGLGTVPNLFGPLVTNVVANEYTYVMSGMTPTGVVPVGPFLIINYTPGTIEIYEDSRSLGTAADYGVSPPNAVAPSSFTDGTQVLVGSLTSFQFVVDTANGTGSFEAVFNVTGGSQLANFPLNQRAGWTFAGSSGNALNIPAGYAHQIDGQTFLDAPVTTHRTTWGRVKEGAR